MVVRIDHRRNGQTLTAVFLEQRPCGAHRFCRDKHVKHDPAGRAAHESRLRQVETPHLIDRPGHHLIQAKVPVQLGDPKQRGVDGVERAIAVQKGPLRVVPGDTARVRWDHRVTAAGNEAFVELIKVTRVIEGQVLGRRLVNGLSIVGRHLALWVEMSGLQGRACLCLGCPRFGYQYAAKGKGSARCGQGSDELASGRHGYHS